MNHVQITTPPLFYYRAVEVVNIKARRM